jgi:hypothetical protein
MATSRLRSADSPVTNAYSVDTLFRATSIVRNCKNTARFVCRGHKNLKFRHAAVEWPSGTGRGHGKPPASEKCEAANSNTRRPFTSFNLLHSVLFTGQPQLVLYSM